MSHFKQSKVFLKALFLTEKYATNQMSYKVKVMTELQEMDFFDAESRIE